MVVLSTSALEQDFVDPSMGGSSWVTQEPLKLNAKCFMFSGRKVHRKCRVNSKISLLSKSVPESLD